MLWKKIIPSVIIMLVLPFLANTQTQKRNLRPDDLYRQQTTGDAQISPDGKWVTYTLTTIDSAKDKRNTDIWMMSWVGSEKVQLTNSPDGESNPRWSPDGKFISFTAARNGGSDAEMLARLGGNSDRGGVGAAFEQVRHRDGGRELIPRRDKGGDIRRDLGRVRHGLQADAEDGAVSFASASAYFAAV